MSGSRLALAEPVPSLHSGCKTPKLESDSSEESSASLLLLLLETELPAESEAELLPRLLLLPRELAELPSLDGSGPPAELVPRLPLEVLPELAELLPSEDTRGGN
eukprot:jgi/Tetstr1/446179/TSEL_003580.t1